MSPIQSAADKPHHQVQFAAIAIRTISAAQRHTGILHKESGDPGVLLLHQAWHCDLRNESPSDAYRWVQPSLPAPRLRQVAALCRKVWRSNGSATIPFAFSPPNDCIDAETGQFLLGPTRLGLTCATFVLAVFQAAGVLLVKYDDWPAGRPGDAEWQQAVVDDLRASRRASVEHIEAMQGELGKGAVRYRPEEVAGAATLSKLPASFEQAVNAAAHVLQSLSA
jgi:hypothetical protein